MKSVLTEMTYTRDRFRERVQEKVAGAYLEFLTAKVFELNGEAKWVAHKQTEVDRLLMELEVLQFSERSGSWKGKVAALQAAEVIFGKRASLLTTASNSMPRYFKRPSKRIPAQISRAWFLAFETRVETLISQFLY